MLNQRAIFGLCWQNKSAVSVRTFCSIKRKEFSLNSEFFENYTPDVRDIEQIEAESKIRKSRGSTQLLQHYFKNFNKESNTEKKNDFKLKLITELKKFPNRTHPTVLSYGADSDKVELYSYGDLHKNPIPNAKSYDELGAMSNTIRMSQLGNFTGSRSYYFMHR